MIDTLFPWNKNNEKGVERKERGKEKEKEDEGRRRKQEGKERGLEGGKNRRLEEEGGREGETEGEREGEREGRRMEVDKCMVNLDLYFDLYYNAETLLNSSISLLNRFFKAKTAGALLREK